MGVELIAAEDLLVDPSRFGPRAVPVDEAQVHRLAQALADGEALPPLVVAPAADPLADWYACPRHWTRQQRVNWAGRERDTPWSRLPLEPVAVVIDGVARYWAHRAAGTKRVPVVMEPPVATATEALARACALNLRNARQLGDADLRETFARLWLGRPVKSSHERWRPEAEALTLTAVADLCGKSVGWCSAMQRYCKVVYALGGLDLGLRKSVALARLEAERWRPFVYDYADRLALHVLLDEWGGATPMLATVPQMSAADLDRLIEAELNDEEASAARRRRAKPAQPATPAPEKGKWFQGELQLDWSEPLSELRRYYTVLDELSPRQAADVARAVGPLVEDSTRIWERAREIARRGGIEV